MSEYVTTATACPTVMFGIAWLRTQIRANTKRALRNSESVPRDLQLSKVMLLLSTKVRQESFRAQRLCR